MRYLGIVGLGLIALLWVACGDDDEQPPPGGGGATGGSGATGGTGGGTAGTGGGTAGTGGGTAPVCGNGSQEGTEECDDGNLRSHDGCSSGCTEESPDWVALHGTSPPPLRTNFGLAYVQGEDVTVLYGGQQGNTATALTFEYDRSTNAWTAIQPDNPPSARFQHAMVYRHDAYGDWAFVQGGCSVPQMPYSGLNDSHEYAHSTGQWAPFMTPGPGARFRHAMVWDSSNERVLLFGGLHEGTYLGDMYEFDGLWTSLALAGTPPSARSSHAMAFDSARGQVVLFGGYDGSNRLADTHEFNVTTNSWASVSPADAPSARDHAEMTYDPHREVVVLFGGYNGNGIADTWEYDGTNWHEVTTTDSPPYGVKIVYDTRYRRVIAAGDPDNGALGLGTWEYLPVSEWPDEVCDAPSDEDEDGLENCTDPDCDGLPCDGGTCVGGTCQ